MSTLAVTVACVTCIVKQASPPLLFYGRCLSLLQSWSAIHQNSVSSERRFAWGCHIQGGGTQTKPPKPLFTTETVSLRMVISAAGKALKRGFMLHM